MLHILLLTVCGARYKTRPGLTYHLSHFHSGLDDDEDSGHAHATSGGSSYQNPKSQEGGNVASGPESTLDGRHTFLPLTHTFSLSFDFILNS